MNHQFSDVEIPPTKGVKICEEMQPQMLGFLWKLCTRGRDSYGLHGLDLAEWPSEI